MLISDKYYLPDNLGEDCPVFENLFEFCQIYAGGTIGNLRSLLSGTVFYSFSFSLGYCYH